MTCDTAISRRAAVRQACALAVACGPVLAAGCRDAVAIEDAPSGVTIDGKVITISLAIVTELRDAGGFLVLRREQVIVLHPDPGVFRAFSNVCSHAGCGIDEYAGRRMRCRCHGSEFDDAGTNVAGPAPAPLTSYPVTFDPVTATVTITKTPLGDAAGLTWGLLKETTYRSLG